MRKAASVGWGLRSGDFTPSLCSCCVAASHAVCAQTVKKHAHMTNMTHATGVMHTRSSTCCTASGCSPMAAANSWQLADPARSCHLVPLTTLSLLQRPWAQARGRKV